MDDVPTLNKVDFGIVSNRLGQNNMKRVEICVAASRLLFLYQIPTSD